MATTYKMSSTGIRVLLRSAGVRRVLRHIATSRGVPAFRAAAPRRTGAFARDVQVVDAQGWDGRAAVRIVSRRRGGGSLPIEFGTSDTPPAHAFARALAAMEGRRR